MIKTSKAVLVFSVLTVYFSSQSCDWIYKIEEKVPGDSAICCLASCALCCHGTLICSGVSVPICCASPAINAFCDFTLAGGTFYCGRKKLEREHARIAQLAGGTFYCGRKQEVMR